MSRGKTLDARRYYTIGEVAETLNLTKEEVEYRLQVGDLTASARLVGVDLLCNVGDALGPAWWENTYTDVFYIRDYHRIRWDKEDACDFHKAGVTVWLPIRLGSRTEREIFEFASSYAVRKDEIVVTTAAMEHYRTRLAQGAGTQEECVNLVTRTPVGESGKDEKVEEPVAKTRPPQLDRAGSIGPLKALIHACLRDFYTTKGVGPKHGTAFHDFFTFLYQQHKAPQRPAYMLSVENVIKTFRPDEVCIILRVKGKSKPYKRKTFETRFHDYKAEIPPQ